MTACADRIAKLDALFVGDLPAREVDELRAHLAGCDGCRAYHDRLWRAEAALEGRAMPARAMADLERRLLAQVKGKDRAPWPERFRGFWAERRWLQVGAPLAVATALALLVVVVPRHQPDDPFRARSGGTGPAFGVRAYCIGPAAAVTGEARPGEQRACPEGSAIQLSVTAPEPVLVTATARGEAGEPQDLAQRVPMGPGVDAPLPFSTPSRKAWLSGPTRLTVRFESAAGQVLAERELRLSP